MASRRRPAAADAPSLWQEPQLGLRLHASGERLGVLLKERERLLRDVQRKKLALEQFTTRAQELARTMFAKFAPLMARHEALSAELSTLFDELLSPGRLSASARKKVAKVRRALQEQGVLGMEGASLDPESEAETEAPHSASAADSQPPWSHADPPPAGHAPPRVAPAPQRGQAAGRESLRAVFRRLALTVHPDHAAYEPERERRTEAMKQVTQAYEDGDLARLLELEKALQADQTLPSRSDDDARCRELERVIRDLRTQGNDLRRELRQLKYSTPISLLETSSDDLIIQAEAELNEVQIIRDFVASFRDGKITLAQFVQGPDLGHDDELDLEALAYDLVIEQISRRAASVAKRPQPKRRKR